MKKRVLIVIVSMLSVLMNAAAQNNFGVTATQAGSSNGNANNVSNDLFTGTANINIPLVSKNVEGIDLGVSISYNTKGIKLDDVSSVVGLGWNLNYGGTITRVVRGLPDEFLYQNANGAKFNYGYWQRNNSDIPYTANPNNIPKHIGETEARTNIAIEAADGQMDIFSLYLNGIKLDFMINANNEVQTIPNNSRVKIQRTVNGNTINTFTQGTAIAEFGFVITDEKGNKFYFKSGEKVRANVKYPCPTDLININEFYDISWNLDYIETYNSKRIQYDYKDYMPYIVKTGRNEDFLDIESYGAGCNTIDAPDFLKKIEQSNKTRLIDKIHFPDLDIAFFYRNDITRCDVGTKVLHYISIKEKNNAGTWNNAQGTLVPNEKIVSFDQNYFSADAATGVEPLAPTCPLFDGDLTLRLKLNEVRFGLGANARTLYSFDYFESTTNANYNPAVEIYFDPLLGASNPYRLNPCQDYWGYYTGNYPLSDMEYIPTVTGTYPPNNVPQGINREPVAAKAKLFALRTITNEAKGCTEFFYGLNEANINGTLKKLDGLRIEEIHNYTIGMNDNTTKHITKYEYANGEWMIPKAGNYPAIIDLYKKNVDFACYSPPAQGEFWNPSIIPNITTYTNHFLGQLDETQHGYGKVTVKKITKYNTKDVATNQVVNEENEIRKTETYFTTMKNVPAGVFNIYGSCLSGAPFTVNTTNVILNPPAANTALSGLTLNNANYFKAYDVYPYTYKQYYMDWALGVPYKTVQYDVSGHVKNEATQEYNVYVNALNTDNYLNLNIVSSIWTNAPAEIELSCQPAYGSYFKSDYYYPYTGRIEVKKEITKSYINNNDFLQKSVEYEYDNITGYPRKTIETQPNNAVVENRLFYNSDNNNWANNAQMTTMLNANLNTVIHNEMWRKEPGQNTFKLLNAGGSGYTLFNNRVRPKTNYLLKGKTLPTASPIGIGDFTVADANAGSIITGFEKGSVITLYDRAGHVNEITSNLKYASFIYDFYHDGILAEVSNSKHNEMAYSSFESNIYENDPNHPYYTIDMGNWLFSRAAINFTHNMTGKRCYNIGVQNAEITSAYNVSLTPGKKYVLSFWKKNNPVINIDNWKYTGVNYTSVPVSYTAYQTNTSNIPAINGWTYCEAVFTATYEKVKIFTTATDCFIDELRLYPADASMTTKCFTPLYGKTTECDALNQILRYEYDETQRVHITRDIKGNIISKSKTAVQSND